MNVRHVIWASIVSTTISCQSVKKEYNSFDEYPVREDALTEMEYSPAETKFHFGLLQRKRCVSFYLNRVMKVQLLILFQWRWERTVLGIFQ